MRAVTQGDVIRADAKDIPRIFQVLYAGEGESKLENLPVETNNEVRRTFRVDSFVSFNTSGPGSNPLLVTQ